MNAREVLLTVELILAVPLSARLLASRPALGPPSPERPCPAPVQIDGQGVRCGPEAAPPGRAGPAPGMARTARMAPARLAALELPIELNHASAAELASLDGIGPRLAARIVAARPFHDVEELARVRGVGARRLERLRPRLRVTPVAGGGSLAGQGPVRLDAARGDGV